MQKARWFLVAFVLQSAIPSFAQSSASPPVQLAGVIQSFSGNTLAIKPATAPAVWVTIPDNLKIDRNALKPNAAVSVEAHWAVVCYVATQVMIEK
jgi:hypothetical protein